jgi:hypothetical protein
MIKGRKIRLVGYVGNRGRKENTHRFSVEESQGQKAVRTPTPR